MQLNTTENTATHQQPWYEGLGKPKNVTPASAREEYFVGRCKKCWSVRVKSREQYDACLFCKSENKSLYSESLEILGLHAWGIIQGFAVLERQDSRLLGFSELGIGEVCDFVTTEGWPARDDHDFDYVDFLNQIMIETSVKKVESYQAQLSCSLTQALIIVADYFQTYFGFSEVILGAIEQQAQRTAGDFWSVMDDCLPGDVLRHRLQQQEQGLLRAEVLNYRERLCWMLFGNRLIDDLDDECNLDIMVNELSAA